MSTPEQVKSCCARAYSDDLVTALLGHSYHPGGLTLTRRLADALELTPGARVLDVASGLGTTALLLADAHAATVHGVDYSAGNVERARAAATERGLDGRVSFEVGDAERLEVAGNAFDAVVCECALCTFPDKPAAAAEFARVLRPGGRLGITDVTAELDRLPAELRGLDAWIACVADARPLEEYAAILETAGLRVRRTERHDEAVGRMVDQIEARLRLLRMTAPDRLSAAGIDPDSLDPGAAVPVLDATRSAIADGVLGYCLLVAERPTEGGVR